MKPTLCSSPISPSRWYALTTLVQPTLPAHPDTNTRESYTFGHKEPHMVPSQCSHGNYCCRWTRSMVTLHPKHPSDPVCMSVVSPQVTGSFSQTDHLFEDDRRNSSWACFPRHSVRSTKTVMWTVDPCLIQCLKAPHATSQSPWRTTELT